MTFRFIALMIGLGSIHAQADPVVTVRPFEHRQVFETSASGFTWYWKHLNNSTNQAEVFQWLFNDLNIEYIRTGFQSAEAVNDNADPNSIDGSKFVFNPPNQGNNWVYREAKRMNPAMKTMTYAHGFPDWLRVSPGGHGAAPDHANPNLHAEIAEWMFANLVNLKQNEGIVCDILDIYNEPDENGFGRDNTANLIQNVVPLLRAWIQDPIRNTAGVTMPAVMASSCLRASSALEYLNHWKTTQPSVWDNIDIVSTHQYFSGAFTSANYAGVNALRGGRPYMVSEMNTLDPEGHLNNPNELPDDALEDQLEAALLQGRFCSVALNNGVSVYDHYQGVSPQVSPASLIFTPWGKAASRRKVYFAFKQLTSMQSKRSNVVPVDISGGLPGYSALAYHLPGESKSWVTVTNAESVSQQITLRFLDPQGAPLPISSVKCFETSATLDADLVSNDSYAPTKSHHRVLLPAHCLRTFEVTWAGGNRSVARDDWQDPAFMSGGNGWNGGWVRSGSPLPIFPDPAYNKQTVPRFFGNSNGLASMRRVFATPLTGGGVLRFKWDVDSLDVGESATALVLDSADNIWKTVWTATSSSNGTDANQVADNLQQAEISLSGFGPLTQVLFRLNADSTGDSLHLDDVEIIEIPTLASSVWQDWRTLQWPGISDESIIGHQSDSDVDGVPNLIEWALGMDPRLPDQAPVGLVHTGDMWKFAYHRPADRPAAAYRAEVSTSLSGDWSSDGVTQVRTVAGDMERWEASQPHNLNGRLFFRLKIQLP